MSPFPAPRETEPAPLSFDALSAAGAALADAALKGASPLTRDADITTAYLSPSPELHGAGAGELQVGYSDGITTRFDVTYDGNIIERRAAVAFVFVLEAAESEVKATFAHDNAAEALTDHAQIALDRAFSGGHPYRLEYVSSPHATALRRTGGDADYSMRPMEDR